MADMMTLPDTVEEFMEEYKLVDTEQVYTNGIELVPIFRMKQWFEHEKAQLFKEDTTSDTISRQAAIDALDFEIVHMTAYCDGKNEGNPLAQYNKGLEDGKKAIEALPSIQPEPTRIIPETRAIPSDDDRVSLSERVTTTYYDDEYEEWSQRTVTVRDVLDAVCDEYTVLPTIQLEPKEGEWVQVSAQKYFTSASYFYRCSVCGENNPRNTKYCPNCGAKMKGAKHEAD